MDNAKQHFPILGELGNEMVNRVRSFMVVGKDGKGLIVATEDGRGFWFGEMEFDLGNTSESRTASKLTLLDAPNLTHMAQGNSHILLLNKQNEIYTMGRNYLGQIGLGTVDTKTYISPKLILIPHKFTSVRCGDWHSLALTEDGKVWAWGSNYSCQVGAPKSTPFLSSPCKILKLVPHRIAEVECGGYHSLALTKQGDVYAWGANYCGQLGDGSESSTDTPIKISTSKSRFKSIAAGNDHTLLLERSGDVYACGDNRHCQLGSSTDTKFTLNLSKITGLPLIFQIASHHATNLSIAMSFDHECFVWGQLREGKSISTPLKLPLFYSTVESPLFFYSHYRNTPRSVTIPETLLNLLPTRMSRMFDNPETSPDVQFVVKQRTIHAHRIILSNSSDYFAGMFSKQWLNPVDPEDPIIKVTIPDYSYQVFYAFLRFIYTDCFELHFDLLPKLFELAGQYLVPELQQLCLVRMRITMPLTPATCCFYYSLTQRHTLPELATFQQELIEFASTQISEAVDSDTYKSMEPDLQNNFNNAIQNFLDPLPEPECT